MSAAVAGVILLGVVAAPVVLYVLIRRETADPQILDRSEAEQLAKARGGRRGGQHSEEQSERKRAGERDGRRERQADTGAEHDDSEWGADEEWGTQN
jgi:hypothetical protein